MRRLRRDGVALGDCPRINQRVETQVVDHPRSDGPSPRFDAVSQPIQELFDSARHLLHPFHGFNYGPTCEKKPGTSISVLGWGPCITERAATGNRNQADAVISIHADGGPHDGRGFHVIHPNVPGLTDDIYEASLRLARALHTAYLANSMPVADYIGEGGFSERDDLGGLNLSNVPAVFLEAGNMRSTADVVLLTDPEFQTVIADAIVTALISFLSG